MKCQRGFTIIEAMVVCAIMIIPMMAALTMANTLQRQSRSISLDVDFLSLMLQVQTVIARPETCGAALIGQPFNVGGALPITLGAASGVSLTSGVAYGAGLIIRNVLLTDVAPVPGFPNDHLVSLTITAEKQGAFIGPPINSKTVVFRISLNAAGTITSCL